MSAVWLLTTRGRPDACQEVLDACEATGMTSPGVVYVDETADLYRDIRLPANWDIRRTTTWGSIAASMRYCLRKYPKAKQYGWLADDMVPQTAGWDTALEEAAGDWHLAYANDLWMAQSAQWSPWVRKGSLITSAPCWGAKLIQAVGWWALPGVKQGGIDGAWDALMNELELGVYLENVIVEHKTWATSKRAKDETDEQVRDGVNYIEADVANYNVWHEKKMAAVVAKVRKAL